MKMSPPQRSDLTELIFLKPKQRDVACWILLRVLRDSPISALRLKQECQVRKQDACKILRGWLPWAHSVLQKTGTANFAEKAMLASAVSNIAKQKAEPARNRPETSAHRRENTGG